MEKRAKSKSEETTLLAAKAKNEVEKHCPICQSNFKTTRPLKKFCPRFCGLVADRDRKREARAAGQRHIHRWVWGLWRVAEAGKAKTG
jgi:hypothetical protein